MVGKSHGFNGKPNCSYYLKIFVTKYQLLVITTDFITMLPPQ